MTDTVRVPRAWLEAFCRDTDPTEPIADNGGTVWDMFCHEAAAMLAASPQGESEWITHDGGPNPVPGKMVDAELGCGVFVNCLSDLLTMFWPEGGRYRVTEGVKP